MSSIQQQEQDQQQQVNIKMEPVEPGSPVVTPVKSNVVVRVKKNSETELQALFDTVLKPDGKKPLQLPWHMRQLPKSFFNPPSTGFKSSSIPHSHENLGDSIFGVATTGSCESIEPLHSRAHSSPATMQQTYTMGAAKHVKQRNFNVPSVIDELGPLPQFWDCSYTPEGQIYFINHLNQTTQWEDPRMSLVAEEANQHQHSAEQLLGLGNDSGSCTPTNSPPHILSTLEATHLQRASTSGAVLPSGSSSWQINGTTTGLSSSIQVSQQKPRSQLERDRLKMRQKKFMLPLRSSFPLLSCSRRVEHSRQESADSGLGLGNYYSLSLPHTPESFLSPKPEDIMDCTSEGDNHGPSANVMSVNTQNMETLDAIDDIVPSLQLEDDLSSDILDEVRTLIDSKIDQL